MALSETTKQVVAQQRRALDGKLRKNRIDIAGLEAQVLTIRAANVVLKKEYDALLKDIPAPIVVSEPE